jgi:DNA-binding transcriptional LysR family regulator
MNLAGIDLNLLVFFDAVMTERSVTRAARLVGRSQPAVSSALGRLRHLFDDPIFVRGSKAMLPTPRAVELYPMVRAALNNVATVFRRPEFQPRTCTARFSIAATDQAELVLLPRLIRRLRMEAPAVTVSVRRLREMFVAPEEELQSGALDFALGTFAQPPPLESGLYAHPLYIERPYTIARADHPLLRRGLSLKQFLKAKHVVVYYPGEGPGFIDRVLSEKGLERQIAISVPHFLTVPYVVAESDLIATVPAIVAKRFATTLSLHVAKCPVAVPRITMNLLWHKRTHAEVAHGWFRRLLIKSAPRAIHV